MKRREALKSFALLLGGALSATTMGFCLAEAWPEILIDLKQIINN